MGDVLAHPLVVALIMAVLVPIAGGGVAMMLLVRDIRSDVLPHFRQPSPGQEDWSLPGRVKRVEEQLHPNGGSSLRDQVNEIRRQLAEDAADHVHRQQMFDEHLHAAEVRDRRIDEAHDSLAQIWAHLNPPPTKETPP